MAKMNIGAERFARIMTASGALAELAAGINWGVFRLGDLVLTDKGERHPDSRIIQSWIAKRKVEAFEFDVLMLWADRVRQEWTMAPRFAPTEHRRRFERVANLCRELRDALQQTEADYAGGNGAGLKDISLFGLLTTEEGEALLHAPTTENGWINTLLIQFEIETVLERLGLMATRFADEGPAHSQPNKRGAERGYFVRRMGELFQKRFGEQPHEVIAALTTIALGETTDRELVAKLLK